MNKINQHSAILIGSYLGTSILNYVFGVTLSWFFLPAQFGVLGVAQSLLLLVSLAVGSGFAWTAAHDIASEGVTERTRRRFRAALLANSFLGLVLSIGLWLAYLSGWLPLGPEYASIVPLVGLTTFILAVRAVVAGAARGLYHFGPVAINLFGEVVVKLISGILLVKLGLGVSGVMLAFALGAFASLLHALWIIRSGGFWQGRGWFDGQMWLVTGPLFLGMLGTALMLNLDVLGLKLLAPSGQGDTLAGLYQAAVILARTPVFIAQALTLVLFSYAAGGRRTSLQQGVAMNDQALAGYLITAIKAWVRLLLPASLVMVLAPHAILELFFPSSYSNAALALQIAAMGCLVLALSTLLTGVFQGSGQRIVPALSAAVAVGAQVITQLMLTRYYGALGAAISLIVAGIVSVSGMLPLFAPLARRMMADLRRPDSFGRALASVLRVSAPLVALAIPLWLMPDGSRIEVLIKLVSSGICYLVVLMMSYWRFARKSSPATRRPVFHYVTQFMQVLMGG